MFSNHAGLLRQLSALLCVVAATCAVHGVAAAQESNSSIPRSSLPKELAQLSEAELSRIARLSPLPALPADPTNRFAENELAARFGQRLFFETRLSPVGVSCATCHDPARAFTDGRPLARGVDDAKRNTPSVLDAARRRWIGWDGKFDSLWSQALSPLENPAEMGSDRVTVLRVIRDDAALREGYEAVFGAFPQELAASAEDPLRAHITRTQAQQALVDATTANILKALGAYQRRLTLGEAPMDRAVSALKAGQRVAEDEFDDSAMRGLAIFVSRGGCYQCHRGAVFTDEEFHNLGFVGANGRVADDPARLAAVDFVKANPWNAAGVWSDAPSSPKGQMVRALRRSGELFGQFRTPSLRGVAETPPYMHDGRLATLADVVRFYDTLEGASPVGHHGEAVLEPLGLTDQDRADLVRFLQSLSGKTPNPEWTRDPRASEVRTNPPAGR
ncbi:MAG: cytochrome c peroxidase [Limnohabitans sp.]|nr:cytochrome c peroxidase [Limnohabitans sp.]